MTERQKGRNDARNEKDRRMRKSEGRERRRRVVKYKKTKKSVRGVGNGRRDGGRGRKV